MTKSIKTHHCIEFNLHYFWNNAHPKHARDNNENFDPKSVPPLTI